MRFNPWRGISDLPRGIWTLFAATLINRAGTMALPFLVLYLTRSAGFDPTQAGLAMVFYGLGSLVAGPLSGWLCDRVGSLRVMQTSLVASGTFLAAFPFANHYAAVLAMTFLWAVVGEAYRPAGSAFLSDLVPAHQRNSAYALHRLAVNLGMSIGPLAGGLLASHVSYRSLFWVDGATTVLAGLVLAIAQRHAVFAITRESCQGELAPSDWLAAWKDRRLLYFMAAIIPVAMVFFQFEGALPLFMVHDLGMSEAVYGSIFLINTILIVLFEVPLNLATSGWPSRRLLALGAFLTAIGFGALGFVTGALGIAATIVVWTFGEMILMPGSVSYVAGLSPPSRRGSYMGMYHVTFSLAFGIGPWIGIALLDRFGGVVLWSVAFCAGTLSSVMLYRIHGIPIGPTQPRDSTPTGAGFEPSPQSPL